METVAGKDEGEDTVERSPTTMDKAGADELEWAEIPGAREFRGTGTCVDWDAAQMPLVNIGGLTDPCLLT